MKTKGVSSAVISAVRAGVAEQLSFIAKHPFDGARIQDVFGTKSQEKTSP